MHLQHIRWQQIDVELRKARERRKRVAAGGHADYLEYDVFHPNCNTLAKKFGYSTKTIQRDIEFLRDEGAPIEYDKCTHEYYYSEDNYSLPAIQLDESDLFAICIMQRAMQQYRNTPLYEKLEQVFKKIEEGLPDEVNIHPAWLDERISFFQSPHRHIDPAIWDMVAKALSNSQRISIDYDSRNAKKRSMRQVDPYHMIHFKGDWYLLCHCHKHNEIRNFAVSRIKKVKPLKQSFVRPESFNPDAYFGKHFGIIFGKENHQVKIQFTKAAAPYVSEREWHQNQVFKIQKNGTGILSFETNHLAEVTAWILSWGKEAQVLEPKELVDKVKSELETARKAYQ